MPGSVTVACKIPNGLILQLYKQELQNQLVMGGGVKEVPVAKRVGAPVTVHGPAVAFGMAPKTLVAGGYALNTGVDADFFTEWMKQNAEHDAVINKLVFAHEKHDYVDRKSKELESNKSGLQPIEPNVDARIPRGRKSVSGIETMAGV